LTIPSLADIAAYEPRWLGVKELNLGDAWRARWVGETTLPDNAPVFYAYAVVIFQGRGYVSRARGAAPWDTLEGRLEEGEKAEDFLKRVSRASFGADPGRTELLGFLECKATSHNREFPPGSVTVRPLYLLVARKMADGPRDSGFERRRLPMNEYIAAIRARYPELETHLGAAIERYLVLQSKGEVP
jgi:hypothetical protein